ncbi:hypothetical protein GCM10010921_19470 [Microbacterium album]|uniref:DUF3040 domain-containing protein n=1 Tax=Microbacterium album TaxID=2053191 RepID=A0A917MM32_9MICO|nr:hypothetical protein GCM10010921_19470 [Microbacterium album]
MHRGQRAARSTVRAAAALLPHPESRIMAETWAADLDHADDLGVDRGDIARGAIAFVVRRGPFAWGRRRWVRAALITVALLVSVSFVPPWFLIPIVGLGLLAWLIASPPCEPPRASGTSALS